MQSFWKLKVPEHIRLKSNANGNLNLIEVQFLTMQLTFCQKFIIATLCQFLKFASPLEFMVLAKDREKLIQHIFLISHKK